MWGIFKHLIFDALKRRWWRLMRRPAPPGDFARYRRAAEPGPDPPGDESPPSPDPDTLADPPELGRSAR
jgi:hypothetical protein